MGGIALIFFYGDSMMGIAALFVVFVGFPLLTTSYFHLMPRSMRSRGLIPKPEDDMTVAAMPGNLQLEMLQGRMGRTISPLRPSGVVEFEGKRIDCVSEGMMIGTGQWVRCMEVRAGRVVVRLIDKPNLDDLENTNFG